jgi:phosphopantetheine--protein transferase-like protein
MILGIGTDIAQIDRFADWEKKPEKHLLKIFSEQELVDCKNRTGYCLEKLASRFATKEAFFKALSATLIRLNLTNNEFSFLFSCEHISIVKGRWGVPQLEVSWPAFEKKVGQKFSDYLDVHLSLSHEKSHTLAFVVISKK